jgi:dsDNA-specific endonuclease/ATPase MutS2
MRIDVYHHFSSDTLAKEIRKMSEQLDQLTAAVAANKDVTDSAVALLTGLHAKLEELIANGVDPAALQTLADDLQAATQKLAEAVVANTPGGPVVPV